MTTESMALSAVIADIYDAALRPSLWTDALRSVCGYIGGYQTVMFWQDATTDNAGTLYRHNDDPEYSELYNKTYAQLNPLFPAVAFVEVGTAVSAHDLVPWEEMSRTRFYREWIAPQKIGDALGVLLERDATRVVFITTHFGEIVIPEEPRQRMALLVPHLQRAVAIGRHFVKFEAREQEFSELLDRLDAGVFLVADQGRIVFANAQGQQILAEGKLLRAGEGRLQAAGAYAGRLLDEGLRSVGQGEASAARGVTVILSDASDGRWTANVLPLGDGSRRKIGEHHHATAAVFVRRTTYASPSPLETLAKEHRLTASEIRVVEALLRVSGLDAIAVALGISRATVKTHFNHIFRKTSVRNQGELIKLISGIGKRP